MVYSDEIREQDAEALRKFYEDKFKVELGNFEGGIDPASIDQKAGTANVKYNVYVARVAVVEITGNTRTKDEVIRRQLRVKSGYGAQYRRDQARLRAPERDGLFSKVEPDVKDGPDPKKPQDVTLLWHVTEQRTASASVGFGYSGGFTGQGLYGTLGFTDNNLHGTGNTAVDAAREGRAYRRRPALARDSVSRQHAAIAEVLASAAASLRTRRPTTIRCTASPASSRGDRRGPQPIPVTLFRTPSTVSEIGGVVATSSCRARTAIERQYRPPPERLHDSGDATSARRSPVRYDGSVAVLFPRIAAEHLRGPVAQSDHSAADQLQRLLRYRRVLDRQREHRRPV